MHEFCFKDIEKAEKVKENLPTEYLKLVWDEFVKDPILKSIYAIIQSVSLQEALAIEIPIHPCEKDYTSLH